MSHYEDLRRPRCGYCAAPLPVFARVGDVCPCRVRAARAESVEMARLSSPVDADGAPVEVTR